MYIYIYIYTHINIIEGGIIRHIYILSDTTQWLIFVYFPYSLSGMSFLFPHHVQQTDFKNQDITDKHIINGKASMNLHVGSRGLLGLMTYCKGAVDHTLRESDSLLSIRNSQ